MILLEQTAARSPSAADLFGVEKSEDRAQLLCCHGIRLVKKKRLTANFDSQRVNG
jgi:hypothetical protein